MACKYKIFAYNLPLGLNAGHFKFLSTIMIVWRVDWLLFIFIKSEEPKMKLLMEDDGEKNKIGFGRC